MGIYKGSVLSEVPHGLPSLDYHDVRATRAQQPADRLCGLGPFGITVPVVAVRLGHPACPERLVTETETEKGQTALFSLVFQNKRSPVCCLLASP